jgi:hypothetical protein
LNLKNQIKKSGNLIKSRKNKYLKCLHIFKIISLPFDLNSFVLFKRWEKNLFARRRPQDCLKITKKIYKMWFKWEMPNELSMSSFYLNLYFSFWCSLARAFQKKRPRNNIIRRRVPHYMNFFIYFYYAASRNFHKKSVYCVEFCVCLSWGLNEHFFFISSATMCASRNLQEMRPRFFSRSEILEMGR